MKAANRKSYALIALAILAVVIIIAYISYLVAKSTANNNQTVSKKDSAVTQSQGERQAASEQAATGTVIKTGDSQYGPMLFDSKGQAIYIWQLEDSSTAECYGNCAQEWPPVLTTGAPIASGDVNTQLLGTTKRTDGTMQVTYNGHPLYYYAHEGPGEVECHNIRTHGGLWWVIQPSGNRAP